MARPFGAFLKELRLSAGFGLRRFAQIIDMPASNLSAIEHGRRKPPDDPEKLREMAQAAGIAPGSSNWNEFFDAARGTSGTLPADLRHMAERELVPALLRTIDNKKLSDNEISALIKEIKGR